MFLLPYFLLFLGMENIEMDELRYPIGKFDKPDTIDMSNIERWIQTLEEMPKKLTGRVKNLSDEQLDTPYRPDGWTVRQLVHHIADSHHHSYTRFKWSLTEDKPLIKAYKEKDWAELFDARTAPIELSLNYIKALHAKMVYLLRGLKPEDMKKSYLHPEDNATVTVEENIGKYAWHGQHHLAHIEKLLERKGWC